MIPIAYLRSSSMNTWDDYCKIRYYMTYGLGFKEGANLKAEHGTTAHKVLEILSLCKLALQNGKNYIDDDILGHFVFDEKDLLRRSIIPEKTLASINKHRSFKQVYKWDCQVKSNVRYGQDLVKGILDKVYDHYQSRSTHEWGKFDKYTIENWIWIPLEWNNGEYDIRRRDIYMPEQNFEIEFKEDWAKYEYNINGKKIEGNLKVKGTIDLITQTKDCLEIVDWKTGQRKNWSTGEKKTFNKLQQDLQLKLYYWAVRKIIKQDAILTIFFIRDGGPTSIAFEDETLEEVEDNIKRIFLEIKNHENPPPRDEERSCVQCSWCDYYKNKFDGDTMNICRRIQTDIQEKGIDKVTEERIQEGSFKYQNPGE